MTRPHLPEETTAMHRTLLRLAAPLALAAALTASACLPASGAETPPAARMSLAIPAGLRAPALDGISGWARMAYGDPRDDVQISVDAHGPFGPAGSTTATRSWGAFRIQHFSPAKDDQPADFNWGDFVVDCLRVEAAVGGTEVSVTGRLVDAGQAWSGYLNRKPLPARMGLSFHVPGPGGRPDEARVGLTPPAAEGGPDIAKCATRPADSGLAAGGYRILSGL
ncbi:hypothetical protein ACGFYU_02665 [Streptomyces sp. NPDC048337]|uniref:hypothetical protein n=1 Tax=Streptomyces sp. NPDC048337 TaxID=3365535 RepID=UPI00371BBEF1